MRVSTTALQQCVLFAGAVTLVAASFVLAARGNPYGIAADYVLAGYLGWRERDVAAGTASNPAGTPRIWHDMRHDQRLRRERRQQRGNGPVPAADRPGVEIRPQGE